MVADKIFVKFRDCKVYKYSLAIFVHWLCYACAAVGAAAAEPVLCSKVAPFPKMLSPRTLCVHRNGHYLYVYVMYVEHGTRNVCDPNRVSAINYCWPETISTIKRNITQTWLLLIQRYCVHLRLGQLLVELLLRGGGVASWRSLCAR